MVRFCALMSFGQFREPICQFLSGSTDEQYPAYRLLARFAQFPAALHRIRPRSGGLKEATVVSSFSFAHSCFSGTKVRPRRHRTLHRCSGKDPQTFREGQWSNNWRAFPDAIRQECLGTRHGGTHGRNLQRQFRWRTVIGSHQTSDDPGELTAIQKRSATARGVTSSGFQLPSVAHDSVSTIM